MMSRLFLLLGLSMSVLLIHATDDLPWVKDGQPGLELEIVAPFLPANPVILEAGGHYGEDTIVMAQKWPKSTIYSFEPCPAYFSKLKQTVAGFSNIHIFPYGLFSNTGPHIFHISRNWDGASSVLEDNYLPVTIYDDYQIMVDLKNLDEWAEDMNVDHIDYMWLDMEGAELSVFKSSPHMLRTVRAISCELNYREFRKGMPHFQEVKDFLTEQGFTLYKIWGLQGGDPGTWQSTGVFIRSSLL